MYCGNRVTCPGRPSSEKWKIIIYNTYISYAYIVLQLILYIYIYILPYRRKYWRGIKFGRLAAKLKSANFYSRVIYLLPKHENRQIKICQFRFSHNPPNIIPANISGYTVLYMYIYIYAFDFNIMYIEKHVVDYLKSTFNSVYYF